MSIKSFNLDDNIAEVAQRLYPRQLSRLINDFLRDLVNAEVDLKEYDTKAELIDAITQKNIDINKTQSELRILKTHLEEVNKSEQKKLDIEEIKNNEMIAAFKNSGIEKEVEFKATFELAIKKELIPIDIKAHDFYYKFFLNDEFKKEVWKGGLEK